MVKITNELWIFIIVGAVAAVGILLLLSGGINDNDISGQAVKALSKSKTTTTKTTSCTDTDPGNDKYVKGTVTTSSGTYVDECYDSDTKVIQKSCSGESVASVGYDCDYGCTDGACNPEPYCSDTDNGKEPGVKGTVTWYDGTNTYSKTDECYSEDSVKEYYCVDEEQKVYIPNCDGSSTCEDGACS
jgi:hypothetical protein